MIVQLPMPLRDATHILVTWITWQPGSHFVVDFVGGTADQPEEGAPSNFRPDPDLRPMQVTVPEAGIVEIDAETGYPTYSTPALMGAAWGAEMQRRGIAV